MTSLNLLLERRVWAILVRALFVLECCHYCLPRSLLELSNKSSCNSVLPVPIRKGYWNFGDELEVTQV